MPFRRRRGIGVSRFKTRPLRVADGGRDLSGLCSMNPTARLRARCEVLLLNCEPQCALRSATGLRSCESLRRQTLTRCGLAGAAG
jgi:hypothetical protein